MTADEKLREALKGFYSGGPSMIIQAKVTAIGDAETDGTISVDLSSDGSLILDDVRLRSTVDGALGMYVVPEVDSTVLLVRIERSDEFMVVGFSSWEKVVIRGENVSLEVGKDAITFNDAALGSFMTDINQLVSKINAIEGELNNLKTVFSAWVPVPMDGGAVLKAAVTAWASATITPTVVADLKDETIKH